MPRAAPARLLGWAAAIALLAAIPWWLPNRYYLFVATVAGIYAVVALALNLPSGYAGQTSLGHAGLFAVGAYVEAALVAAHGWPFWTGWLLAVLAGAAWGVLLAMPSLRVRGPYLALVTIGFGIIVQNLALEWEWLTGGAVGIRDIRPPEFLGFILKGLWLYYLVVAIGVLVFWVCWNLVDSRYGRALVTLRDSELAAGALGIDSYRHKMLAFVLSAAFTALAGALFAHVNGYVNPEIFGPDLSVFMLVTVMFGGAGTLFGPVIGAVFLTLLPELSRSIEAYRTIAYGLLLLFSVLVLPEGMWGWAEAWRRGRAPRRQARADAAAPSRVTALPQVAPPALARDDAAELMVASGIRKAFGGVQALDGADLTVLRGSITGLIGPNGSGKTTLLNVISGVYAPDAGEVLLARRPVQRLPAHRIAAAGVARTFQNVLLDRRQTVWDNVLAGCYLRLGYTLSDALLHTRRWRTAEDTAGEVVAAAIARVGMWDRRHEPCGSLPYGQQRLVEIARAVAASPCLLLLDEPAAGLSPAELEQLMRVVVRLRDDGISVLLVEHRMDMVMGICDAVVVLDQGRTIAAGTAAHIRSHPRVVEAYLGGDAIAAGG